MNEALQIPEIILIIGSNLPKRSLLSFSSVCKAWHHLLQPSLWKRFRHRRGVTVNPSLLQALERNGSFVQELILDHIRGSTRDIALHCNRLNTLSMRLSKRHDLPEDSASSIMLDLVQRNQGTLRIFESGYLFSGEQKPFEAVLRCPNLEQLWIYGAFFSTDTLQIFWDTFPKLRRLCLMWYTFQHSFKADDVFPNLTHLRLVYGCEDIMAIALASHCPNLETLVCSYINCPEFWEAYTNALAKCPKLLSISFLNVTKLETMLRFLKTLPPMKYISLEEDIIKSNSDGRMYLSDLQRHFGSLETVNFAGCSWVENKEILLILSSCPSLRILRADHLSGSAIEKSDPWVCQGLEELIVAIVDVKSSDCLDRQAIYDQFSRLGRLRILDMYPCANQSLREQHDRLDFKLGFGLERLESFKRLKLLAVGPSPLNLDVQDVEWMSRKWSSLEVIKGRLHQNYDKHVELQTVLEKCGLVIRPPAATHTHRIDPILFDELE